MRAPSAACLPLLLLAGCPSLSTLHTARPLPVGETEVVWAGGAYLFDDDGDRAVLPFFEGQVRHGFGSRWDAGLKASSASMLTADVNAALVETPHFALSVDPTGSILAGPDFLLSFVWLPLLADIYTSDTFTATLSARWGYAFTSLDDPEIGFEESTALWGAGIGGRWRASEKVSVLPELNVLIFDDGDDGLPLYTFSLGFAL